MEALLTEQKTEIDELNRLIKNYKADGPTRKTERYLTDKCATFPELFRVIEENDTAIQELREPRYETQSYFLDETFGKLKAAYEKVMDDIKSRLEVFKQNGGASSTHEPTSSSSPPVSSKLDTGKSSSSPLSKQQQQRTDLETNNDGIPIHDNNQSDFRNDDALNNQIGSQSGIIDDNNGITDQNDNAGNVQDTGLSSILYDDIMDMIVASRDLSIETSPGMLAAHASTLNSMWTEFRGIFYREKAAGKRITFNFSTLLQKYMMASGRINDLMKKPTPRTHCEQVPNIQFNLPKLKLPEFNGKVNDWKRFIALFDRMVHNNASIDNGIKIEYLKTCVRGQAAKIINHIDPNPENYLTCYELLRKRFENKRELLGALIDNILLLPKLKTENADLLKTMHDTVYEAIMSIKNMDVSTDNWDPLLCHMLTRKLDPATVIHYECQLQDVREPQTLASLLTYLENRFMALQSANIKRDYQPYNGNNHKFEKSEKTEKNENSKQSKCVFCKGDHYISKCDGTNGFLKKNVSQRIEWARENKACLNCFGAHRTFDCKSKFSCRTCHKRHNSILHMEKMNNDNNGGKSIRSNVAKIEEPNSVTEPNSITEIQSCVASKPQGGSYWQQH